MSVALNLTQLAQYYGGPLSSRNRLVNPMMSIDQANEGALVTLPSGTPTFCSDQWRGQFTQASPAGTTTIQTVADAPASLPGGRSIKFTMGTGSAISAGDSARFSQNIESFNTTDLAFGTASALPISVSFWVKSSVTGTYSIALRNGTTRSYLANFTVATAATWTYIAIPNIPGDTAGTWVSETNALGLSLGISFGAGSTFQCPAGSWQAGNYVGTSATTNLMATTGATIQVTGVQLEPGAVCTPLERRPFAQELILCQRFFQKTTPLGIISANGNGLYSNALKMSLFAAPTTPPFADWRFPVEMRAGPTILSFNPRSGGTAGYFTNSITDDAGPANPSNNNTKAAQIIAASNLSASNWYIHSTADARL